MTDPVAGVEKCLAKQGYPLEFQVARTFQAAGFRTWQSLHYRDTEGSEQRTREIDVVAAEWPEGTELKADVELVVEVKHSHEPWLILTTLLWPRVDDRALSLRLRVGRVRRQAATAESTRKRPLARAFEHGRAV